jgi:hypothetical protein
LEVPSVALLSFLDRERIIAHPGYSRWLVPPAALAIHLSIGQAYAFSVFNLPLSRLIGGTTSAPGDWRLSTLGWIFSIAIVFLGLTGSPRDGSHRTRSSGWCRCGRCT